jgi:hypothetical protein
VLHMIKGAITTISALSPIQFLPFSYFNQDGNTPCRVASVLDGASNLFRSKGFCPCPVSRLFRSNYVIIHVINYWNATVVKSNDTPFLPWWKQHVNSKHPKNIHFTSTAFDLVIVRCSSPQMVVMQIKARCAISFSLTSIVFPLILVIFQLNTFMYVGRPSHTSNQDIQIPLFWSYVYTIPMYHD